MAVLEFADFSSLVRWAETIPNVVSRYALYTNATHEKGASRYFIMLRKTVATSMDTAVVNLDVDAKELEAIVNSEFFGRFRDVGRLFPLASFTLREE